MTGSDRPAARCSSSSEKNALSCFGSISRIFSYAVVARSRAIGEAQQAGDPDLGDTYYLHWLTALETLVRDKGIASPLALTALRQAWAVAAEKTPHGRPIELSAATRRRLLGQEGGAGV